MSSFRRVRRRRASCSAWLRGATLLVGLAVVDSTARATEAETPPDQRLDSSLRSNAPGDAPDGPQQGADPGKASSPQSSAEALYEEAKAKRAQGDFEGARALLERCYGLSKRPELLFNLGQLERQQGHCASALAYYRDYVERVPEGRGTETARTAIRELGQECPSTDPTEPPALDPATERETRIESQASTTNVPPPAVSKPPPIERSASIEERTRRVLGWCGVGAGALAAGTAVYFALDAADAHREANALLVDAKNGTLDGLWDERGAPLERQEQRSTRFAVGSAVVGGILSAAGTTLLLWDSTQPPGPRQAVAVALSPGAASAKLISNF